MSEAVVTSYTELIEGLKPFLAELRIRYEDFDTLCDFPEGLTGKAFGPSQVKRLGPEKLFDALRGAGCRLRLERDPEQFEKMKKRIADNFLPRHASQARPNNHASPVGMALTRRVFKYYAKIGGKASMSKKSKAELRKHQQAAANARWKAERKRRKAMRSRKARAQLSGTTTTLQG